MLEAILRIASQYWHLLLPAVAIAYFASNYFNKGFNRFPGPALAQISDVWRFVDVWNRRPDITHVKLHRQHGSVVRLGPNSLSFSDPAAIKTIYGLNKGFVKVRLSIVPGPQLIIPIVWVLSCPTGSVPGQTSAVTL